MRFPDDLLLLSSRLFRKRRAPSSWRRPPRCRIDGGPRTALAQDTSATPQTADPPCSEPSSCPGPDSTQDPEVTCYEPHSASGEEAFTVHIYGVHLAKPDAPPERIVYRNNQDSGSGGYTKTRSTKNLPVTSRSPSTLRWLLDFGLE